MDIYLHTKTCYQSNKIKKLFPKIDPINQNLRNSTKYFDEKTNNQHDLTTKSDLIQLSFLKRKIERNIGHQDFKYQLRSERCSYLKDVNLKKENIQKISIFQKIKRIIEIIRKLCQKIYQKFLIHLSNTSTADKYIRLIYSFIKLYRALYPKNKLADASQKLLNTRRIIQWEFKYQLIQQFCIKQLSIFDVAFKTLQISGNMFDFLSFWLNCLSFKLKKIKKTSQYMYQWQDDCYFYQCIIETIRSIKNLFKSFKDYMRPQSNIKQLQLRDRKSILIQQIFKLINLMKRLGLLKNVFLKKRFQIQLLLQLYKKIKSKEQQIKKIELKEESNNQELILKKNKEMVKYLIKTIKYMLDSSTSFNNYSGKFFSLDPLTGGLFSLVSSIFSLCLIWCF